MRGRTKRAFFYQREHKQALDFNPDIVICNLGINDLMDWERFGRADFVSDYKTLLKAYQELPAKPKLYLWTPLAPLFPGQTYYGSPHVKEINDAIATVVKETGATPINMFAPLQDSGKNFPDHIHPNAAGTTQIAEETARLLKPTLKEK